MTIDWTLNMSDVLLIGGGILAFVKMSVSFRDAIRDLSLAVGSKHPPSGLLGDVETIKDASAEQREMLVEMRAKLGFK